MSGPAVEIFPSHASVVGDMAVRRALPRRGHRTVGAWCFADHMGPITTGAGGGGIGPHPHIGLQTVTWLVAGELLHRDSLGSERSIRPGQLNLMTAGHGIAHAEEGTRPHQPLHRIQLWVAQPEATRHGPPAFEHHADLPEVAVGGATATVLVGELAGAASPARRDTDHVGAELRLPAGASTTLPIRAIHEHALIALEGSVLVDGVAVEPGSLSYLGPGRDALALSAGARGPAARVMLLGGVPFPDEVFMWWNYVGRSAQEVAAAHRSWQGDDGRFGAVPSKLDRITGPSAPSWP